MTIFSSNLETPDPDISPDKTRQRHSRQSLRRKLSPRRLIRRHLGKMLRSRWVVRTGFAMLLLAGFIHISLMNNVLGPRNDASYSTAIERSDVRGTASSTASSSGVTGAATGTLKLTRVDPVSVTLPVLADDVEESLTNQASAEPRGPATKATGVSVKKTATYVVNEGGSLWRAGKRFIDDDALLDTLIDNLAQVGMDVRSVRPGVAFIVHELGSEDMQVIIENGGNTYESHISRGSVTTSVLEGASPGEDRSGT